MAALLAPGPPHPTDRPQAIKVRLLAAWMAECQDPEGAFFDWLLLGVPVGAGVRLPRTPAIFERKTSWTLPWLEEEDAPRWVDNYSSARDRPEVLRKGFLEEEAEGMMVRTTLREAQQKYGPRLAVAALGALEKEAGSGKFRIIFDGTHGVHVNHQIRVRDRVRFPTVRDLAAVLSELHEEGGTHFGLTVDVAKAHRRVPVREEDWGVQACQIEADRSPDAEVWLNTVGTFGVASAAYWWGRLGAAILRGLHYALGRRHPLWALLYADDGLLVAPGADFARTLLLSLLFLQVLGVPFAWKKVSGGLQTDWVGYWLDVRRFQVGISERRCRWVRDWIAGLLKVGVVLLRDFREGLGRLASVAGPLEMHRPFLGPLYAWVAACPPGACLPLPLMARLVLQVFARKLEAAPLADCTARHVDLREIFRVDAKAEGNEVAIGGWASRGGCPGSASWFAVRLSKQNAPWAFARGEPFRVIASLELLAVLVAVMVLVPPQEARGTSAGRAAITAYTDNQGNGFVMDRLMTTRFPLCAVLMEVAHQLDRAGVVLDLRWIPRLQNIEADALTNWEFEGFDPARRIHVDLAELPFAWLPDLLRAGEKFYQDIDDLKEAKRAQAEEAGGRVGRRLKLRDRDPW